MRHLLNTRPAGVVAPGSLKHQAADAAAGSVRLAVMICTRDRREELSICLASLAKVERPADTDVRFIIVDNATPPQEASIRASAASAGLEIIYGHEPRRGYASPRNRALEMAIADRADVLLFIDDDVLIDPALLVEHLNGLKGRDADVSMGGQTGKSIGSAPRYRKMKVATFNVAFRRWLIDPPAGRGLRFDERLNLTGYEDHEFFYEAQDRGARMYRNGGARITMRDSKASVTQKSMSDDVLGRYIYATGRNWSYVRRIRYGALYTWPASVWMFAAKLGRIGFNAPIALPLARLSPRLAQRARRQVLIDRAFVAGLWGGLTGPGVERAAAKRGEIILIRDEERR